MTQTVMPSLPLGPYTQILRVTPEMARRWLTQNTINRPLNAAHVAFIAKKIEQNEWMVTHQGIAFSSDGTLLDGQHRLAAIVQTGKAILLTVTFGQDIATFAAIDDVRRRSTADALKIPYVDVAVCRWILRLRAGSAKGNRGQQDTPAEIAAVYAEYQAELKEIEAAASPGSKVRSSAPIRTAALARLVTGHRAHVLMALRAFAALDLDRLPKVFGALLRGMQSGTINAHGSAAPDLMVRSWMAFDPARAGLDRLTYREMDLHLAAMGQAFAPGKRRR